jgi:hypothetical protein
MLCIICPWFSCLFRLIVVIVVVVVCQCGCVFLERRAEKGERSMGGAEEGEWRRVK